MIDSIFKWLYGIHRWRLFYRWIFGRFLRQLQGHVDAEFDPEISRAIDGCQSVLEYLES